MMLSKYILCSMQFFVILEYHELFAIFCKVDRFSWWSILVYQVYSEQVYHELLDFLKACPQLEYDDDSSINLVEDLFPT